MQTLPSTLSSSPTVFKSPEELSEKLVDYFALPETYEEEEVITFRDGRTETRPVTRYRPLPMLEDFCVMHRITSTELREAAREFPETVGRAVQFAKDVMKTYLVRKGLVEQYNPNFAKFVATNEVDMVDKSESVNRNLNVSVDTDDILDKIEKASKPLRRA